MGEVSGLLISCMCLYFCLSWFNYGSSTFFQLCGTIFLVTVDASTPTQLLILMWFFSFFHGMLPHSPFTTASSLHLCLSPIPGMLPARPGVRWVLLTTSRPRGECHLAAMMSFCVLSSCHWCGGWLCMLIFEGEILLCLWSKPSADFYSLYAVLGTSPPACSFLPQQPWLLLFALCLCSCVWLWECQ